MSEKIELSMPLKSADLLGRWSLLSWRQVYDDGRATYPMGQELHGFVQYGDQHMACMIAKRLRPPFTTGGQWSASGEEKAAAYESFMAYCGTYEVSGDTVSHHVESSLFPNWEGGVQKRRARLANGQLQLTARLEEGTPEARTATLLWQRANS